MAFTGYCTVAEVKDRTLTQALTDAEWLDADIQKRIDEGYAYLESKIMKLGFNRTQLLTAPLVNFLNYLYARYAILRDIYQNASPSDGKEAPAWTKWKKQVDETLEGLEKNEIKLTDGDGDILQPAGRNLTVSAEITTANATRMITLEDAENWDMGDTNSNEDVVGLKESE